jgi:hypothetical protein
MLSTFELCFNRPTCLLRPSQNSNFSNADSFLVFAIPNLVPKVPLCDWTQDCSFLSWSAEPASSLETSGARRPKIHGLAQLPLSMWSRFQAYNPLQLRKTAQIYCLLPTAWASPLHALFGCQRPQQPLHPQSHKTLPPLHCMPWWLTTLTKWSAA